MYSKQQLHQLLIGALIYVSLIISAVVYWPGLNGSFMLDDFGNLRPLEQLDNNPFSSLTDVILNNESGPLGRPIAMLSFAANYLLDGNAVWSYKYTNLGIHLLCGLLIIWLIARLLAHTTFSERRWVLALFAGGLWLLDPMWVSTTLYVVQRMAQLSCLFMLAGLLCYIAGRERLDAQPAQGFSLLALCFLLFLPLAAFSKENGVLLPLLALCIELFFFGFKGNALTRKTVRYIFLALVALPTAAGAIFLLLRPDYLSQAYSLRDVTFEERVLTEPRILFSYIRSILLPTGPSLGLFHDDYLRSTSPLSPPSTLLAILAWLALLSLPLVTRNNVVRWLTFGIVFFLAGQALESTILPLELYFEHRNYLPSFGVFFSLAIFTGYLFSHVRKPYVAIVVLSLFPITFAFATYQRSQTWGSYETIILSDAARHPQSLRLNTELATYYANHRQIPQALKYLNKAESIDPNAWSGVALQRIALYCISGTPVPTQAYNALLIGRPVYNRPYTTTALEVIRNLVEKNDCPQLDPRIFFSAINNWLDDPHYKLGPYTRWKTLLELGQLQFLTNRPAEAIITLKKCLQILPRKIEVGLLIVKYQLASGDINGATELLKDLRNRDSGARNDVTEAIQAYTSLLDKLEQTKNPSRS